ASQLIFLCCFYKNDMKRLKVDEVLFRPDGFGNIVNPGSRERRRRRDDARSKFTHRVGIIQGDQLGR
ncbi:MAG: hypothetical protein ACOYKQ_01085, partial [Polymorphobacter sp.]